MVVDGRLVLGTVLLLQLDQHVFAIEGKLTIQVQLCSKNISVKSVSKHLIHLRPLQEVESRFFGLLHETHNSVPTVYVAAKASSPPIDRAT